MSRRAGHPAWPLLHGVPTWAGVPPGPSLAARLLPLVASSNGLGWTAKENFTLMRAERGANLIRESGCRFSTDKCCHCIFPLITCFEAKVLSLQTSIHISEESPIHGFPPYPHLLGSPSPCSEPLSAETQGAAHHVASQLHLRMQPTSYSRRSWVMPLSAQKQRSLDMPDWPTVVPFD